MTGEERLAVLRLVPELAGRQERDLLGFFDEVTVPCGESVAVEGAPCHQLLVLAEGRLEARGSDWSAVMRPGDSFGWAAMRERGPNPASVVAQSDARVLVMSHAQFRAAEPPPPKNHFLSWALPSSRRPLPHPTRLQRA